MNRAFLTLAALLTLAPHTNAVPTSQAEREDVFVVGNGQISRTLQHINGSWRTTAFAGADNEPLKVESDEFLILLLDGTELTAADYTSPAGQPAASRRMADGSGSEVLFVYELKKESSHSGAPKTVTVRHTLAADEPYARKSITATMNEGDAIDRLEVERFRTKEKCERSGKGEPIFIGGRCFVGLEYPGSYNEHTDGLVTLAHYPGLAKKTEDGSWAVKSKTSVVGVAPTNANLRFFFDDYIQKIRIPIRNMVHYNSWYDLRVEEVNAERLVETFRGFRENLCRPYGIEMDTFVPDDGYQEKNSIWKVSKAQFPRGLQGLRDKLEAMGTRLGIWLPLNGYLLNPEWGEAHGMARAEVNGEKKDYYCLADPTYDAAIRAALKQIIEDGNLAYMKHDFNWLACDAEGHAHLPTKRHGHEANLDAQLELLAYQRQVQKDIFLNVTSCVWHSPWWLMHADAIWMAAGDHGFNFDCPQLSAREGAMSYRDVHFYKLLLEQGHLVPLSSYMTHGIIYGTYEKLGGEAETMREWSDYCMLYYGRGVQLKELYITPSLMTPERWRILGETTRWAIENKDNLKPVRMFGADPRKGGAYGYAHWLGNDGLIVLRNPGLGEQTLEIPWDASVGFRGEADVASHARIIYPYVEELPDEFLSARPFSLSIPGASVVVLAVSPGAPATDAAVAQLPALPELTALAVESEHRITASIPVPDEEMPLCSLRILVENGSLPEGAPHVSINGTRVTARGAAGPDWIMRDIDLRAYRGQLAEVDVAFPTGAEALFMKDIKVSAWWMADRAVAANEIPDQDNLPYVPAQGYRRQSAEIIAPTDFNFANEPRALSDEELATIKAAKLRMMVFGANASRTGKKSITLNGKQIMTVPASAEPVDSWHDIVVPLDERALRLIRKHNTLVLDNKDGDYYKFRSLGLAVQLADGTWVRSNVDDHAQTSVDGWAHQEGPAFKDHKSEPVALSF